MKASESRRVRVSAKGWVVIPARLRKKYGITPGSTVEVQDDGGRLVLLPRVPNPVDQVYGMLADGGASLTEALLAGRAEDRDREEAKLRT